jgi:hypothetical protein
MPIVLVIIAESFFLSLRCVISVQIRRRTYCRRARMCGRFAIGAGYVGDRGRLGLQSSGVEFEKIVTLRLVRKGADVWQGCMVFVRSWCRR